MELRDGEEPGEQCADSDEIDRSERVSDCTITSDEGHARNVSRNFARRKSDSVVRLVRQRVIHEFPDKLTSRVKETVQPRRINVSLQSMYSSYRASNSISMLHNSGGSRDYPESGQFLCRSKGRTFPPSSAPDKEPFKRCNEIRAIFSKPSGPLFAFYRVSSEITFSTCRVTGNSGERLSFGRVKISCHEQSAKLPAAERDRQKLQPGLLVPTPLSRSINPPAAEGGGVRAELRRSRKLRSVRRTVYVNNEGNGSSSGVRDRAFPFA